MPQCKRPFTHWITFVGLLEAYGGWCRNKWSLSGLPFFSHPDRRLLLTEPALSTLPMSEFATNCTPKRDRLKLWGPPIFFLTNLGKGAHLWPYDISKPVPCGVTIMYIRHIFIEKGVLTTTIEIYLFLLPFFLPYCTIALLLLGVWTGDFSISISK